MIESIADHWNSEKGYLAIKIDTEAIGRLQLDLSARKISDVLGKSRKLHLQAGQVTSYKGYVKIEARPPLLDKRTKSRASTARSLPESTTRDADYLFLQNLRRILPDVVVSGYPEATRAVIKTTDKGVNSLLVEGYGLRDCMITRGVDGTKTRTNSVIETRQVLGIEAARATIIAEVDAVMGDMDIDPRHIQLLADVMTYRGEVLGITRFGLAKMRDSVLQLASFEKTPDHLFEAAWRGKVDRVEGVSECIIMGQPVGLGTGAMKVVRRLGMEEGVDFGRKSCAFEDAWEGTGAGGI